MTLENASKYFKRKQFNQFTARNTKQIWLPNYMKFGTLTKTE